MASTLEIKDFDLEFVIDELGKTNYSKAGVEVEAVGIAADALVTVTLQNYKGGEVGRTILRKEAGLTDGTINLTHSDIVSPEAYTLLSEGDQLYFEANAFSGAITLASAPTVVVANTHSFETGETYSVTKDSGIKKSVTTIIMEQRNYYQTAVADRIQLGKDGSHLVEEAGRIAVKDKDLSALVNFAIADAIQDDEAATLKQVKEILAAMAQKGGMIVADLVTSPNPWAENEIRITSALEFQRKEGVATAVFTPADGSVISVAKELIINAGLIIGNDTETTLKADHIYIYDTTLGKLFDNGAVADKYDEKGVKKAMIFELDSAGAATGIIALPKATIFKVNLYVSEVFDGTVNNLKLMLDSTELLDFSLSNLKGAGEDVKPMFHKNTAETTPTITGSIDGGTTGKVAVVIEYVID